MSRYNSEQMVYNLLKKYVPLWKLVTNAMTVTHFNVDTLTVKSKTYHTDYIMYHYYSESKYPDTLRRLVNEVNIIEYLDDLELKVGEAIARQVERWEKSESCPQRRCREDAWS